jgi:hypothetical protein
MKNKATSVGDITPGIPKYPFYLLLVYIIYQVMCCRNIKKQISSSLGRINQAQAGITFTRPDYSFLGLEYRSWAGIKASRPAYGRMGRRSTAATPAGPGSLLLPQRAGVFPG